MPLITLKKNYSCFLLLRLMLWKIAILHIVMQLFTVKLLTAFFSLEVIKIKKAVCKI